MFLTKCGKHHSKDLFQYLRLYFVIMPQTNSVARKEFATRTFSIASELGLFILISTLRNPLLAFERNFLPKLLRQHCPIRNFNKIFLAALSFGNSNNNRPIFINLYQTHSNFRKQIVRTYRTRSSNHLSFVLIF